MPVLARRAETTPPPEPAAGDALGPLDNRLGFWLRLAQQSAFEAFHRAMSPLGLTPGRFAALLLLESRPDLRQGELAEALRVKPSNLAVLVAALEADGLIRRDEDARNRRANRLRLTPSGRALLRRAKAQEVLVEAELCAALAPGTREALIAALRRIAGA